MKPTALLALCAASRLALAVPLDGMAIQKRALVVQTKIVNVVQTVTSTTTITLGDSEPTEAPKKQKDPPPAAAKATPTTSSTSTFTPPPSPAPVIAHQNPAPKAEPKAEPKTEPKPQVQPVAAPAAKAEPKPAPPPPPPAPKAKAPPTSDGGSGSGSGHYPVTTIAGASVPNGPGPFKGTATHYDVGLGACGWSNSDSEMVLAISHLMMGDQSNGNPLCGRFVNVKGPNGTPVRAKVVDKCMDCHDDTPTGPHNIDLSPGLFKAVGDGDGVIDVTWSWA